MATGKGSDVQFMVMEEDQWGTTPSSPDGYVLAVSGLGGDWYRRNLIENPELRANRSPSAPVRGNVSVNGSATVPLHLDSVGWLLKYGVGIPALSGSYVHTSKVNYSGSTAGGDLPPGLTVEHGYTDIGEYHVMAGCRIATLGFNATSEGVCTIEAGFIGEGSFTRYTTSRDTTPTSYTSTAIDHFAATIQEGGSSSAIITDINFTLDNGMDDSLFIVGGSGQRGSLPAGIASVTGSLTALFQDNALLTKAINHTESSLQLTWTSGSDSLQIDIPELVYEPASPAVSGPAGVRLSLNFQGYYANGSDSTCFMSTLTNTVSSYVGITNSIDVDSVPDLAIAIGGNPVVTSTAA